MAEIKCPMCGKPNPAELDVCQFCEARLKPVTDELARSQPPIHPGDEPTDMATGDLEPVLPQWLREARQQSRDSSEDEPEQAPVEEKEADQPEEPTDLLAGLQSQADDDEEIPDWLSGLRGDIAQAPPEETSTDQDDLAALKSMLGEDIPETEESEASALPGWISDLGADEVEKQEDDDELSDLLTGFAPEEEPAEPEAQPAAFESDFEWGADFESESGPQAESTEDAAPIDSELPGWLQGTDEEAKSEAEGGLPDWMSTEPSSPQQEIEQPAAEGETPDWLASLGEESAEAAPQEETVQPAAEDETPDWLAALDEESTETAPQETTPPTTEGETPDWLASLGEESAETAPQEIAQPAAEGETPDWLASLGEESAEVAPQEEAFQPAAEEETPDWLTSLGEESAEAAPQEETVQPVTEGETPDWLASLGEESAEAVPQEETVQPAAEGETPDWLAAMSEKTAELEEPPDEAEVPALAADEFIQDEGTPAAFAADEEVPATTDDVDALFSMDMPDWLSDAEAVSQVEGDVPAASAESVEVQGDDLRPADLPDWVQAMRPVEDVISETGGGTEADLPMEEQGPLAGLRGVLPAVPGVGPSSKPKAYSIKLEASEDQQSGAALLEQMLAAEINPKPIATQPVVLSQRLLRWVIAIVLLLVVGGSVFTGTQMNPLPTGAPPETSAALRYIQNSLPVDAPVLLIFDYDAALAGELEVAAAPLVDQMLTLKGPRLSLISSTPVGAGLAESFMEILRADRDLKRGESFINLGYLPGGAAGVLAFSVNPVETTPLTTTGENAWATVVLQDVKNLSNFQAIILLTDNVETARIWIEQTEPLRGETRFLVISSAQSGPMILPYVQSGQVDGIVTGLDGGAPIERVNSGRPGKARRYWDAYGFGLLAALAMISIGSLWSLISGWRERRKEQGEA